MDGLVGDGEGWRMREAVDGAEGSSVIRAAAVAVAVAAAAKPQGKEADSAAARKPRGQWRMRV